MQQAPVPENEGERLQALHELELLDTPPEERFDRLCRMACAAFSVDIAYVSLIAETRQWYKAGCGLGDITENPRLTSFCGHTVFQNETVLIPDMRLDPRFHDSPYVLDFPGVRFYLGQPLRSRSGYPVGTFCLLHLSEKDWQDGDLALFLDFAATAESELNLLSTVKSQAALLDLKTVGLRDLDSERTLRDMLRRVNLSLGCENSRLKWGGRELCEGRVPVGASLCRESKVEGAVLVSEWLGPGPDALREQLHGQLAAQFADTLRSFEQLHLAVERQKDVSFGALAAGVAHQVNNPLGATSLSLGQARTGLGSHPAVQHLQRAETSLGRARDVLEALLDLAEASSGEAVPVALESCLSRLAEGYQRLHAGTEVRLEYGSFSPESVTLDEAPLQSLLWELLDNARLSLEERESREPIVLKVEAEGGRLMLAVRDRGVGMEEELLSKALEPFVTTRPAGQGLGLGLTLAKKLASELGGELSLQADSEGCQALLSLPL